MPQLPARGPKKQLLYPYAPSMCRLFEPMSRLARKS
jgi:hypothetical protein